ncbi:MAG: hypothetical protein O6933_04110 [Planctomycetota bacterium]|nr:hypothetical protein [Planctomycetota bacterium]
MTAYRMIFALAAIYNAAFGAWAVVRPHSFFTLFDLNPPLYPWLWACVGMVLGIYGIAYAYVAWRPDHGDVLVVIGLLGKVLGPIGWLWYVWHGTVPPRTFPLILTNDLVWWFPFLFYLLRNVRRRRSIIAWAVVVVHFAACLGLVAVRSGTEAVSDFTERVRWVAESTPQWTTCWLLWVIASLGIAALFVVWGQRLAERSASRTALIVGCAVCAIGVPFDLVSETLNIVVLTSPQPVEQFAQTARACAFLGAGIANGLYCVGGVILSFVSWKTGFQRGWLGLFAMAMWSAGLALTATTFFEHREAMVVTGAVLMVLFLPWSALTARRI